MRSPLNIPLSSSPLNKLPNMQPYDDRRERNHSSDVPLLQFPQTPLPTSPPTTTALPSTYYSQPPTESYDTTNSSQAGGGGTSDFSMTDEGSDSEAKNLSRPHQTSFPSLDSIYAAKKVRHLRKSAMKRRWNPLMLSGLATNPSTGNIRVQCHVCLKTFHNKWTLRTHFSAVHLREMHKCTVDGCNKMFSSRFSRDRHTANPNPKLHTPNLRRKLSNHDGRSSMNSMPHFPIIPPSSLMGFSNGKGSSPHKAKVKTELNLPSSTMDDLQSVPGGSTTQPNLSFSNRWSKPPSDEALSLNTKTPMIELNNGDVSNEEIDLTMKEELNGTISTGVSKGVSKRKSFNSTKCATVTTSDEDLQYVSTDDSSSDTFVDDNGMLSKSDDFSSDMLEDDSKDDDISKDFSPLSQLPTSIPITHHPPTLVAAHTQPKIEDKTPARMQSDMSSLDLSVMHTNKEQQENNHQPETEEVSKSPLRYRETLSLGAYTGLLNHTKSTFSQHIASTTGISYHAPGLGLASTPNHLSDMPSRERRSLVESTPLPLPIPSSGESMHDSDPDGQMRDASIIGAVDVPLDKENPRRCIACGKIYRNPSALKNHYQNVHLKLMHMCTVVGCNATFPSQRSRDRHSANLNLHRKLLSTSVGKGHFFNKGALFPYPHPGVAIRDYFSRLYDPSSLPMNLYHVRFGEGFLPFFPFSSLLGSTGPFHPAFMVPTTSGSSLHESGGGTRISDDTPISSTPSLRPKSSSPSSFSPDKEDQGRRAPLALDSDPVPDSEGRFACRFCQRLFVDAAHLRDHYEGTHLPRLLPCPVEGCHKVFLTALDRDTHCEAVYHNNFETKREKAPHELS